MTVLDDDFVLPFEIDRTGLRGRLIRLGPAVAGRGAGVGLLSGLESEIR